MKIHAGNQHITRYNTGLGSNVLISKGENLSNLAEGLYKSGQGIASASKPISPSMPVYSTIKPSNITDMKAETIDEEFAQENVEIPEEILILTKKTQKITEMLKKLGIDGTVGTSSMQTVPQSYTMHYIEMADSNKQNMVIFELESGELVFGETSLNEKDFWNAFNKYCINSKLSGSEKLSADELEGIFAEFFGVKEMKRL